MQIWGLPVSFPGFRGQGKLLTLRPSVSHLANGEAVAAFAMAGARDHRKSTGSRSFLLGLLQEALCVHPGAAMLEAPVDSSLTVPELPEPDTVVTILWGWEVGAGGNGALSGGWEGRNERTPPGLGLLKMHKNWPWDQGGKRHSKLREQHVQYLEL